MVISDQPAEHLLGHTTIFGRLANTGQGLRVVDGNIERTLDAAS